MVRKVKCEYVREQFFAHNEQNAAHAEEYSLGPASEDSTYSTYLDGSVGDDVEDASVQHDGGQQAPPLVLPHNQARLFRAEPDHRCAVVKRGVTV